VVWPTLTNKLVLQGLKNEGIPSACVTLVSDAHAVFKSFEQCSNMGPADNPEGSCEFVKWCQVSQQW